MAALPGSRSQDREGYHVRADRRRHRRRLGRLRSYQVTQVRRRLRYTKLVEKPALGLFAGVGATVIAAPVVGVLGALPLLGGLVGAGTAIAIGAGVGTGVALGVRDTKEPPKLIDD